MSRRNCVAVSFGKSGSKSGNYPAVESIGPRTFLKAGAVLGRSDTTASRCRCGAFARSNPFQLRFPHLLPVE